MRDDRTEVTSGTVDGLKFVDRMTRHFRKDERRRKKLGLPEDGIVSEFNDAGKPERNAVSFSDFKEPASARQAMSGANRFHKLAKQDHRNFLIHVVISGLHLLALRKRVGKKAFARWVKSRFHGTQRTAQYYMQIAENRDRLNFKHSYRRNLQSIPKKKTKKTKPKSRPHLKMLIDLVYAMRMNDWTPVERACVDKGGLPPEVELACEEILVAALTMIRRRIQTVLAAKKGQTSI